MLLKIRPSYEFSASMSCVPFASFDSGLFFLLCSMALDPPTPYSRPDKLCQYQEDSGPVSDPVDICCLLHMWLDLTQARRWEREIPGGGMHSSAADPLGGTDLGTADKTFSLELDHHGRNAPGLIEYTGFLTRRFLMQFIRLATISNLSVSKTVLV